MTSVFESDPVKRWPSPVRVGIIQSVEGLNGNAESSVPGDLGHLLSLGGGLTSSDLISGLRTQTGV